MARGALSSWAGGGKGRVGGEMSKRRNAETLKWVWAVGRINRLRRAGRNRKMLAALKVMRPPPAALLSPVKRSCTMSVCR
jgi:hypothetical protein